MNAFAAGLVPHRVGIRSVAQKSIAIQRDPLASVLDFMCGEPFLLGIAMVNSFQRKVRDGHVDALLLDEGKRFKRTQQPVLVYRFQFPHHDLIVAEGSGPRVIRDYAKIPSCTLPAVSVSLKSRPE
jgi:hypothetical protein